MKCWIGLLLLYTSSGTEMPNNVCKTFAGYFDRYFSHNCWYNPDVTASASSLIQNHGYPMEIHEAVTEDFYILQIFRIPAKGNDKKGIVFLQHPVTASCTVWIDLGNRSLAFMLADAGYDVWIGNFRGTIYSDKHVYLSSESNKYWNFSFHEYGFYDLPAQLDVVKRETGNKEMVYYVGHSASTTAAYVYTSLRSQHAKKTVRMFISLAPIASLRDLTSPTRLAAPFADILLYLAEVFHVLNFIPHHGILHFLIEIVCNNIPVLCAEVLMIAGGKDWKYADPGLYPILVTQNFAGFSSKVFAHYAQIYNAKGRFQLYNYGSRKNKYYYNSKQPPLYPIENITVPMFFMYGGHDTMAAKKDVFNFYSKLPSQVRYGIGKVEPYNHFDFLYSKEVDNFVYKPIMQLIENMSLEMQLSKTTMLDDTS